MYYAQGGSPEHGWWELAAVSAASSQLNCVAFDTYDEAVWAGTDLGVVSQLTCPTLERYCSLPAHHDQVLDLQSAGEAAISLSAAELCVLASGGAPRLNYSDQLGDLAALHLDHHGRQALLGRSGGGLFTLDLATGKPAGKADTGGRGVVSLCGPVARGTVVMGSTDGYVVLLDPRNGHRVEHCLLAHGGGFAALDAQGEFVATCGYANRMGRLSLEGFVKVFDVRMHPRMLASLPFTAGPSLLRFHPRFSSTLLVGSAGGAFCLADATGLSAAAMHQVDTEGDALLSAAISPSGECIAFGGSGGYIHLWGASEQPSVAGMGQVLTVPAPPAPMGSLSESDPLAMVPTYFSLDGTLLSDLEPGETMAVGLPPRRIEPELLSSMKQSDFVGYIQNPAYRRGAPVGEASRAMAAQRNKRVQPQLSGQDREAARAERARQRAAAGGIVLPGRYKRVQIKQQTTVRFEEFDFSYYNRTPFTGLENDLANCYTNALLQVLFFTLPMREALMAHVPDPACEFSLSCEVSFLFRMLATAGGAPCQAANLLRCLRQSKEAAALGLLEGVRGERVATDIEVETNKDRSLSRRVQSLSRFLLEALNKEAAANGRPSPIERTFAMLQRQRTQCLSRPQRPEQVKDVRTFQVDLQYPPAKDRPAPAISSPTAAAEAAAAGAELSPASSPTKGAGLGPASSAASRPSFSDVLRTSLILQSEMRAWFDEEVRYQYVRQSRVPTALPQVLAINCGLQDRADLCWWQPVVERGADVEGRPATVTRAWLPFAIAITADPERWEVDVQQGGSSQELELQLASSPVPAGGCRAVYELTALVSHIRDEDEEAEAGMEYEGHLVATIKVPPTYYDAQRSSAGSTPRQSLSRAESGLLGHQQGSTSPAAAAQAAAAAQEAGGEPPRVGSQAAAPALPPQHPRPSAHELAVALLPQMPAAEGRLESQQLSQGEVDVIRNASNSLLSQLSTPGTPPFRPPQQQQRQKYEWLVFNDFHITPCLPEEVTELYGGQKAPCLLYYTQSSVVRAAAEVPPSPPAPVLTPEGFLQLCRAPPLQGPKVRLHRPTFTALGPMEVPRPGMLLALDAEFVAYSPPEKVVREGREVEARPSRLGLARVSVVRGEGPGKGTCCVDDYIKSAEPVYDYLTKFSGLVPGDLDLTRSPHYLTTLKRAYTKLRYLIDSGCVFVGHGLKKDFRMINILVPQEQIIDTVELFHLQRSRKLSLRFLASYLLQSHIQTHTHDSIEDACTALRVYDVYRELNAAGVFEAKLREMYDWGKIHGWEPVIWKDGRPQVAPPPPPGPLPLPLGLPPQQAGPGMGRGPPPARR